MTGNRLSLTSGYGKVARNFQMLLNPENTEGDVSLWLSPPYKRDLPKGFNVLYTMHELDTLPAEKADWIENMNKYDLILVPTSWNRKNFIKFGVTKPIEVVPLGVDSKIFKGEKTEYFSVLTLHDNFGRDSSRENWRETVEVFILTFYRVDNAALFIKTWNYKTGALETLINETCEKFKINKSQVPPITIYDKERTDAELNEFYSWVHLFVKNANREGWSLPLNEALSAGVKCAYRSLPSLTWAEHYPNSMVFYNEIGLQTIMQFNYLLFQEQRKRNLRYDIRNSANILEKIIESYYSKL